MSSMTQFVGDKFSSIDFNISEAFISKSEPMNRNKKKKQKRALFPIIEENRNNKNCSPQPQSQFIANNFLNCKDNFMNNINIVNNLQMNQISNINNISSFSNFSNQDFNDIHNVILPNINNRHISNGDILIFKDFFYEIRNILVTNAFIERYIENNLGNLKNMMISQIMQLCIFWKKNNIIKKNKNFENLSISSGDNLFIKELSSHNIVSNLKKNIEELKNEISKLKNLNGNKKNYKISKTNDINFKNDYNLDISANQPKFRKSPTIVANKTKKFTIKNSDNSFKNKSIEKLKTGNIIKKNKKGQLKIKTISQYPDIYSNIKKPKKKTKTFS